MTKETQNRSGMIADAVDKYLTSMISQQKHIEIIKSNVNNTNVLAHIDMLINTMLKNNECDLEKAIGVVIPKVVNHCMPRNLKSSIRPSHIEFQISEYLNTIVSKLKNLNSNIQTTILGENSGLVVEFNDKKYVGIILHNALIRTKTHNGISNMLWQYVNDSHTRQNGYPADTQNSWWNQQNNSGNTTINGWSDGEIPPLRNQNVNQQYKDAVIDILSVIM